MTLKPSNFQLEGRVVRELYGRFEEMTEIYPNFWLFEAKAEASNGETYRIYQFVQMVIENGRVKMITKLGQELWDILFEIPVRKLVELGIMNDFVAKHYLKRRLDWHKENETTAKILEELTPVGSLKDLVANPFVANLKLYYTDSDLIVCDMTMTNGDVHSVSAFEHDYSEAEFYSNLIQVFAQGDEQ